jgi:cytoskeletal protein RodZ
MTWRIDPKTLKEKAKENKSLSIFVIIVIVGLLAQWVGV